MRKSALLLLFVLKGRRQRSAWYFAKDQKQIKWQNKLITEC